MSNDENDFSEPRQGGEQMSEAEIDYNVMGSFPASDPPSWEVFEGEKPSPHDPSHQNEPNRPA